MPDIITEIEEVKTRLRTFWLPRDDTIRNERILLNLVEPREIKGFTQMTMNEPKVLYDTSVALISGFEPKFRLPLANQSDSEKNLMNKAERLLIGIFRSLNHRQRLLGKDSFFRELAYYVCSGWVAAFPYLHTKGDDIEFRCELYDPITIYPEWDSDGLLRLVRTYETNQYNASALADSLESPLVLKHPTDNVTVDNYWKREKDSIYNTVIVGGKVAKPLTKEPYDRIPILIQAISGSPRGPMVSGESDWIIHKGESVIAANKSLFKSYNFWMSMLMQIVKDKAYPGLQDLTATGQPKLRKEDVAPGAIYHRQVGEEIKTIDYTGSPIDVNLILQQLSGALQRGGLPYVIYGGLPFELSGFALSQLLSAVRHKLNPYMNDYSGTLSDICLEFLRLFKLQSKSINLAVEKPERRGKGEFFMEDFDPKDIPVVKYVEVTVPLSLPVDKAQQVVLARQAISDPPLLSRPTLWDEVLDVQDAHLEYERIIEDQLLELPVMKTITLIERLRGKADSYKQQDKSAIADSLNRYADQLEQSLSQPTSPEATIPKPGGMSPGVLPEEATTGSMADKMKAMLGKVPTGEAGLPARPGE